MDKPVIPAEVADAIEALRVPGMTNERIVEMVGAGNITPEVTVIRDWVMRSEGQVPFPSILHRGYQRGKSLHERIRERFDFAMEHADGDSYYRGYACAMADVLDLVDITVEGVNSD